MDTATMMAMAGKLFGGKQLGGIAPAFNSGQPASGGLLGQMPAGQQPLAQPNPLQSALGTLGQTQAAQDPGQMQTPVDGAKAGVLTAGGTPGGDTPGGGFGQGFGNFLGGIDKGLQSPSQMLGLGLLSRLGGNNNALPIAGLLGMGLFNRTK
jgi:hypothetical protein